VSTSFHIHDSPVEMSNLSWAEWKLRMSEERADDSPWRTPNRPKGQASGHHISCLFSNIQSMGDSDKHFQLPFTPCSSLNPRRAKNWSGLHLGIDNVYRC